MSIYDLMSIKDKLYLIASRAGMPRSDTGGINGVYCVKCMSKLMGYEPGAKRLNAVMRDNKAPKYLAYRLDEMLQLTPGQLQQFKYARLIADDNTAYQPG